MEEQLRNAAARGDCDQLIRLLTEKVKSTPDESGRNALHLAAAGGFQDVVAALLQAKWDVNLQDTAGCTALQRAAAEGHIDVVRQLIKHGANVNIQDKVHGNAALHEASWKGYSRCVQALCQAPKVNLQIKNAGGFAPLHLACQNGHNQSCRELLMANCNPDVQNNYGDTPLHTSARYGHAGVTRILISADCHMSDQNKNGDTALHITAAMGRRKLTRILLEAGCDLNKRNKQNERAKDIAIRKDLSEIVEIIDNTVPAKKKDKQREKKEKNKENEKKREKESGSSKDSSTRPKDKKKPRNDQQIYFEGILDTKWSPYGCHYYPDSKTFPKPKLDSLPQEPLKKGEQYFLDLAGNIRKGPVGVGYTCYCAPFFRHMEERLDRDKKELKEHIDAAQSRLDKKVTNLEVKTRSQLDEITRSIVLERAKCRQRHLHLEQWLVRGSVFRHSDKPRPSLHAQRPTSALTHASVLKAKSLENILEERPPLHSNLRRSVDILNDYLDDDKDKNRNSSLEGKESGKGSSDVGDLGTSGEDEREREMEREKESLFVRRLSTLEKQERPIRRSTREISERIDQVLRHQDGAEGSSVLCDEMAKWRSYRMPHAQWVSRYGEENQSVNLCRGSPDRIGRSENRRSYHELLREKGDLRAEQRLRRLSDPRGAVEESEQRSVKDIVSKLQKQHTVQELVAKIQKKTGMIHKSAQRWKENKLKSKEKRYYGEGKKELETKSDKHDKMPHNYENVRQWDVPQQKLSQLPYRCRSTVYSPGNLDPSAAVECQRHHPDGDSDGGLSSKRTNAEHQPFRSVYHSHDDILHANLGSAATITDHFYGSCRNDEVGLDFESGKTSVLQAPHNYSPTQNDSGYSTKPYGGSSTGPSPSLSGKDYECASTEIKPPLPLPINKRLKDTTSSLV